MSKLPRTLDTIHLDELRWAIERCRGQGRGSERRFLAVFAHHAEKRTLAELAQKHGVSKRAVSKWVATFRNGGVDALESTPRKGKAPRLDANDQEALTDYLAAHRTPTESEARQWLSTRLGREVSRSFARYWKDVAFKKLGVPRRKRCRVRRTKAGRLPAAV
jgi:transposase